MMLGTIAINSSTTPGNPRPLPLMHGKMGFTGVCIIFVSLLQNIYFGYSLELPHLYRL